MPKVLDDCIRKVKADLIKKGLSEKEAESRAWAICRKSTGYQCQLNKE